MKKQEIWKFIRFMLCNQTAWLVDVALFALGYQLIGLHYAIAKAISYTGGAVMSYTLNRKFTFHAQSRFVSGTLLRFIIVNCVSISLSIASMALFSDVWHLPVWVAYFLSIIFSFSCNFLGNRFWVFRNDQA